MGLTIRLTALVGFASTFCLAGNWPGYLVDSRCYAAEERNMNPSSTLSEVNRDRNFEIRTAPRTQRQNPSPSWARKVRQA